MSDDDDRVIFPAGCAACQGDVEIRTDADQSDRSYEWRAFAGDAACCTSCGKTYDIAIGPYLVPRERKADT